MSARPLGAGSTEPGSNVIELWAGGIELWAGGIESDSSAKDDGF